MSRQIERSSHSNNALRHPDGSINFDAYRERARHARTAAITASIKGALSLLSGAFADKPVPAAKHHAT
jgi:hypothetical protein